MKKFMVLKIVYRIYKKNLIKNEKNFEDSHSNLLEKHLNMV